MDYAKSASELRTEQFSEQFGEEFTECLCESAYSQQDGYGITFTEHRQRNALNYYHFGYFERDGVEWFFCLNQGDEVGCEIEFGPDPIEKKEDRSRLVFVPVNPTSKVAKLLFPIWQREEWFIKKQSDMNYDFHFSPTSKIHSHYRDWAAKKGLVIERVEPK